MSFVTLLMLAYIAGIDAGPVSKVNDSSIGSLGPLTFKRDGTFQISIFEDLHFGENAWDQWGPQQDINSVKVINEVLEAESPGLVVLNGDLITGENGFLENSTVYVDQIVGPLVDRGLTWASTYGNHDYDFNISGSAILAREKQWGNSRTTQMVFNEEAGTSNYYLPVYDSGCNDNSCSPELILWFFDSRGGFRHQQKNPSGDRVGQPDWVDFSVVNWFIQTSNEIVGKYGKIIPSLAFVHIPTYASYILQKEGVDPHAEPGINDDNPLAPQAQGWCSDGRNDGTCDYGGQDIPFMQAISAVPGLMAVFSGHDHGNSWCYKWDRLLPNMTVAPHNGVNLCFGQHSGYGGYGNWERGARQVLATKSKLANFEVDTWIRLESGNVVGSISLNSTYGQDKYPATNNSKTHCPTCHYDP
ncbi:Metallo-dependent phosphatase [Daldinia caldariorum]|uniref:Metallo-dependent phosphatase n=1 Tax=Daldinia caldariorum TaxID=326644 RepID=UPI00200782DE|nr:Metallo-dependent phosphatase [Daldinia caldariorum]KAI1466446.1 Metallo-dependent phosphatase [Daldinia caldariorum]